MSSSESRPIVPLELTLRAPRDEAVSTVAVQREVLELFDACAPGLHRYVRSCGLTPDMAEDIVQETFLLLFRHLRLGGARENLQGWLFRVSYRLALKQRDRVMRRERRELPWMPHVADAVIDPADDPEVQLVERQRYRRVRAVINALPERDRQCLHLRAEGLRYREIAKTLEISLGAVAKSLARAVLRLTNAQQR